MADQPSSAPFAAATRPALGTTPGAAPLGLRAGAMFAQPSQLGASSASAAPTANGGGLNAASSAARPVTATAAFSRPITTSFAMPAKTLGATAAASNGPVASAAPSSASTSAAPATNAAAAPAAAPSTAASTFSRLSALGSSGIGGFSGGASASGLFANRPGLSAPTSLAGTAAAPNATSAAAAAAAPGGSAAPASATAGLTSVRSAAAGNPLASSSSGGFSGLSGGLASAARPAIATTATTAATVPGAGFAPSSNLGASSLGASGLGASGVRLGGLPTAATAASLAARPSSGAVPPATAAPAAPAAPAPAPAPAPVSTAGLARPPGSTVSAASLFGPGAPAAAPAPAAPVAHAHAPAPASVASAGPADAASTTSVAAARPAFPAAPGSGLGGVSGLARPPFTAPAPAPAPTPALAAAARPSFTAPSPLTAPTAGAAAVPSSSAGPASATPAATAAFGVRPPLMAGPPAPAPAPAPAAAAPASAAPFGAGAASGLARPPAFTPAPMPGTLSRPPLGAGLAGLAAPAATTAAGPPTAQQPPQPQQQQQQFQQPSSFGAPPFGMGAPRPGAMGPPPIAAAAAATAAAPAPAPAPAPAGPPTGAFGFGRPGLAAGPPPMAGPPMAGPPMSGPPMPMPMAGGGGGSGSGLPPAGPPGGFPGAQRPPPLGPPHMGGGGPPQQQQQQQQQYQQQQQQHPHQLPAAGPPLTGEKRTSQPGTPSAGGGPGGVSRQASQAPATPAQRIDPSAIPRPRYTTPSKPTHVKTTDPSINIMPHAWSDFVAEDNGNANPRMMRCTLGRVPTAKDVLKECKLPLALAVMPLATPALAAGEVPVPVVSYGEEGPLRCTRCRGYISCHCQWTERGGRAWTCALCGMVNDAPPSYVVADAYGRPTDRSGRPELTYGTVEFEAPPSVLLRPAAPLAVVFVVDVSFNSVASGVLEAAVASIRSSLDILGSIGEWKVRAGIIAHDTCLHFYDCNPSRREPAYITVGDVDDAFAALAPDQWLPVVSNADARRHLETVLDRLPSLYPPTATRPLASCTGSAIKAAIDGLGPTGGRVIVFHANMPQHGEGKVSNRESLKSYGTDKEKEMYLPAPPPAGKWYEDTAKDAAGKGVSIDLLLCSSAYTDLATMSVLCSRTGGEVRQYPAFPPPATLPSSHAMAAVPPIPNELLQQVAQELQGSLLREYGTEGVLKVRASLGFKVVKYSGNFHARADTEADLPGVDADKAVMVHLAHDGNEVKDGDSVYLQAALLYTTAAGHRRTRVHNLRLQATDSIQTVFRHADIDTIMGYLLRKGIQTTLENEVRFVNVDMQEAAIDMLLAYRKHCATNSSPGQLILPESLKLLPLYLSAAGKLCAFLTNAPQPRAIAGRNPFAAVTVRCDQRVAQILHLQSIAPGRIVPLIYPRLFRVDTMSASHGVPRVPAGDHSTASVDTSDAGGAAAPVSPDTLTGEQLLSVTLPPQHYPSMDQVTSHAMYLLEHPTGLFLYVSLEVDEDVYHQIFGDMYGASAGELPVGALLPQLSTDMSLRLWTVITALRARRPPYLPLTVVAPSDTAGRELFASLMAEDKVGTARSYVDLLCHMHTAIQSRLTQA